MVSAKVFIKNAMMPGYLVRSGYTTRMPGGLYHKQGRSSVIINKFIFKWKPNIYV
jgi:hypothetical protein